MQYQKTYPILIADRYDGLAGLMERLIIFSDSTYQLYDNGALAKYDDVPPNIMQSVNNLVLEYPVMTALSKYNNETLDSIHHRLTIGNITVNPLLSIAPDSIKTDFRKIRLLMDINYQD